MNTNRRWSSYLFSWVSLGASFLIDFLPSHQTETKIGKCAVQCSYRYTNEFLYSKSTPSFLCVPKWGIRKLNVRPWPGLGYKIVCRSRGAFNNYVFQILTNFDPLHPWVHKPGHFTYYRRSLHFVISEFVIPTISWFIFRL